MSVDKAHLRIAEVNPDYRWAGQEARRVAKDLREQAKRLRGEATALEDQAFRLESILKWKCATKIPAAYSTEKNLVIYSANEAASNDAGFWSNNDGWVEDLEDATRFSKAESKSMNLPMSTGRDASWCSDQDF